MAIGKTTREALEIAASSSFVTDRNRESTIIGSPSRVLKRAREFTWLGMEQLMIRFLDFPSAAGVKLFSKM